MAKYKIGVTDACIACGACVPASSDKFKLEATKAEPAASEVDEADIEDYKKGVESCPVQAIKIEAME